MIALSAGGLLVVAVGLGVGFLIVVATVAIAGPTNPAAGHRGQGDDGRVTICPDCRGRGRACRYHTGYRAGYHAAARTDGGRR